MITLVTVDVSLDPRKANYNGKKADYVYRAQRTTLPIGLKTREVSVTYWFAPAEPEKSAIRLGFATRARVLVRFDHVVSRIINANHKILLFYFIEARSLCPEKP